MALSPNYQWAEPDNSSLVKNGAQDIRALGDAIDTSVWNVGFGQAGKNKIINGDFYINQRSFTSNTTSGSFNFDRWKQVNSGGTFTLTPQTFTPGAAPVTGYEGKSFLQGITSGQSAAGDLAIFDQNIEDVRTFAGQTITVSFFAKAGTGTPKIGVELGQQFGTGGTTPGVFTAAGAVTISTSWARYSVSVTLPTLTGKTITTGTDSALELLLWVSAGTNFTARSSGIGIQNNTFQIWGVQVEAGSKATPFQTASETIQGELALCQRYYYRIQNDSTNAYTNITGIAYSTTGFAAFVPLKTTMRVTPTAVDFASLRSFDATNTASITAITLSAASPNVAALDVTSSSLTQYRPYVILGNTVPSFIGFSAEL